VSIIFPNGQVTAEECLLQTQANNTRTTVSMIKQLYNNMSVDVNCQYIHYGNTLASVTRYIPNVTIFPFHANILILNILLLSVFKVKRKQLLKELNAVGLFGRVTCGHHSASDHSRLGIHRQLIVVIAEIVEKMRLNGALCPTVKIASFHHALLTVVQLQTINIQYIHVS